MSGRLVERIAGLETTSLKGLDGSTIRATLERLDTSPPQGSATHGPIEAAVLGLLRGAGRRAAA